MKCLVSGATGFIGRHLCQHLVARGDTVIALSRLGEDLPGGLATKALDLSRDDVDEDCLRGVEVVFHLAGIAHQHAPDEAYDVLNVDATRRLASRAARSGVRCFIFLSSVKAMGPSRTPDARSELDCEPPHTPYAKSKWRAECALRDEFRQSDMAVIILRPALVYGEYPKGNLELLAKGIKWGLPRPPSTGARSMIALPDLVDLLCLLSVQQPEGVNTWVVAEDHDYSTREVYDSLRLAAGKGSAVAWLPQWCWRLGAWLMDRAGSNSSEATWDKLFGSERYSSAALAVATGWRPRHTLKDLAPGIMGSMGESG